MYAAILDGMALRGGRRGNERCLGRGSAFPKLVLDTIHGLEVRFEINLQRHVIWI
jgi:hypothetical protein